MNFLFQNIIGLFKDENINARPNWITLVVLNFQNKTTCTDIYLY